MIRINLLGVERPKARKPTTILDANQRTTFGCVLVFGLTLLGVSAWYWSLSREAARLETEIATAQQEMVRLQAVLEEIKRAEARRTQLQERVKIIGELRRGQSVPVQLLDHISRSVPDMLWLTALDQKNDAVQIEGRTTTLISLADFVANLGTNKLVTKPIDIVNSEVEASSSQSKNSTVDVIKFSVKAPLTPRHPQGDVAAGAAGAAGRGAKPPASGTPAAAGARSAR
jgi:type IV pilus assembly protein PilN